LLNFCNLASIPFCVLLYLVSILYMGKYSADFLFIFLFWALQYTLISSSDTEAEDDKGALSSENLVELLEDVIKPLSELKVDAGNHDP